MEEKSNNKTERKIIKYLSELEENIASTLEDLELYIKNNDYESIIQFCEILLRKHKEKSIIESMLYAQGIKL